MRGIAFVALCSCVLVLGGLSGPVKAGDYGSDHVWYSSGCCYQKIVRHERDVRYLRAGAFAPYYETYPRPDVHVAEPHRVVRFSEFDYYTRYGDYGRAGCYWREAPLHDWRGWVWGVKVFCF